MQTFMRHFMKMFLSRFLSGHFRLAQGDHNKSTLHRDTILSEFTVDADQHNRLQ